MILILLILPLYAWGGAMSQPLESWGPEKPWSVRSVVPLDLAPLTHPYARLGAAE